MSTVNMEERIVIDFSKGELDFIREAIQVKHLKLMAYLDSCEGDPIDFNLSFAEALVADEEASKKKEPFVYKPKAKYGLKKDGTPKAKPGKKA
jgi:hypothetical protein